MSSVSTIAPWQKEVQRHFPKMSLAQVRVLAEISYAMMMTMHSGTTHVSHWLAKCKGSSANTVRQRVREWYYEASAKRGRNRQAIQVEEHFADLLAWVLEGWEGEKRLAIALDATQLAERFTSLSLGVVLGGCLIPVAWAILPTSQPGAWKPHWLRLLEHMRGVIPGDWHVIVLVDQGLYAAWLYQAIQQLGWHPMMRVPVPMGFRLPGEQHFRPIDERLTRRGRRWQGQGEWSEQGERMSGTLLMCWERGYEEKLAVVTDEEGADTNVAWYQMRFWTEDGFKDQKRGGWRWEQTKMQNPQRVSRLWLALALTLLWAVRVGSEEEGYEQRSSPPHAIEQAGKRGRPRKSFQRPRAREQSLVVRGQQSISVAAMQGRALPVGHVIAQPWPGHLFAATQPAACWHTKRRDREKGRRDRHTKASWKQLHQQHLAREQERETKRLVGLQRREERAQEQEAKRLARQERKQDQETARQSRLARQKQQAAQASPAPCSCPSAVSALKTPRPDPVLQLRGKQLVPFSRSVTVAPPCPPAVSARSRQALVTMRHGCLRPLVTPALQENPP